MFILFKKKTKTETELDFFKRFLHADYEHYAKHTTSLLREFTWSRTIIVPLDHIKEIIKKVP